MRFNKKKPSEILKFGNVKRYQNAGFFGKAFFLKERFVAKAVYKNKD